MAFCRVPTGQVLSGSDYRRYNMKRLLDHLHQPFTFIEGPDAFAEPFNGKVADAKLRSAFLNEWDGQREKGKNFYRFSMAAAMGHRRM